MFEIGLSYIRQHEDTAGPGNDEVYVIIFALDLAMPATKTTLNGPFEIGAVVGFPVSPELCWGFDGQPRDIDDADNALILVALLESDHDDSPPDFANSVRTGVQAEMDGVLLGYIPDFNAGNMDLETLRSQLIDDMRGAVDTFRILDLEHDERLGPVQLLRITAQDLDDAQTGTVELRKLTFVSHEEDSKYDLKFKIGAGVGSVGSGIGTGPEPAAIDPNLDHARCAAVSATNGNNLDLIDRDVDRFKRIYSSDGGNQWFFDATLSSEGLLVPKNQIGQGVFSSGPAGTVSADGKQLHVFGRGSDNRIWRAFSPDGGTNWTTAWVPIGSGVFTSAPAAAVSSDGKKLHVFGRGTDNRIWRAFSPDGGKNWSTDWRAIGTGVFTSAPAAAVSADGKQLDVFGRGTDNKIYRASSPDGGITWSVAWLAIGSGVFTSAPAAAVSSDGKKLHVFGRGSDNKIWRAFSPDGGANWTTAWVPIGSGVFSSGPAAVISGDGKTLRVFGRGAEPPDGPGFEERPKIWRAFSPDGGANWSVAWAPIEPQGKP